VGISRKQSWDRRVLRLGRVCLAGGVVATITCAAALAATPQNPVGPFSGCPGGLQPLSTTYKAAARHEAIVFLATTYAKWNTQRRWGMRLAGTQVGEPFLVLRWLPSGWIKTECGNDVWRRSVAVRIRFPAMEYPNPKGPCNACAQLTLLLGKTHQGWVTWGNY